MNAIASALGIPPIAVYAVLAILAAGGFWGYGALKYHDGYVAGKAEASNAAEAARLVERERQDRINADAREAARKREEWLAKENTRLQSLLDENANAADQDPRRDEPALSSDGVQRLNKVRRLSPKPISPTGEL
ncbi:hypothetical protein [Chelatococcus sp. YT9]|uniref:hypothetical protein n=1 Tax=Chelatococcus sp. YT9 TaxID=2835635 RepID=UPI001BCD2DE5|nr:hypothetical protein [Chelatococcus sp. YT9]MBS7698617.1 hypothetical protein [Chelatococcus sp. YT9]